MILSWTVLTCLLTSDWTNFLSQMGHLSFFVALAIFFRNSFSSSNSWVVLWVWAESLLLFLNLQLLRSAKYNFKGIIKRVKFEVSFIVFQTQRSKPYFQTFDDSVYIRFFNEWCSELFDRSHPWWSSTENWTQFQFKCHEFKKS